MHVFLGADHAGFDLKNKIKVFLLERGYEVSDEGAFTLDPTDDYPDFVEIVAKQVQSDAENYRGIILGGSGQGEAIAANRHSHVRAVVYCAPNLEIIRLSREHNNANILSLGARFLSEEQALEAVKVWLATDFSGDERHIRRLQKIEGEFNRELSF